MKRFARTAAITLAFSCLVVSAAGAIYRTANLDGPLGAVFVLLVMVAPVFIAGGVAISVWRLMSWVLPPAFQIPERLLFAISSFIVTCGSGPLVISAAIAGREGPVGAAGVWAVAAIAAGCGLCLLGIVITLLRLAIQARQAKRI